MRKSRDSSARKPLSLPGIYMLLALSEGSRHGYGLKQHVEERTGGAVKLGPGTLYETIQRLEESGLVEEAEAAEPANGQEAQRRYYRLTARGLAALKDELRQLGRLVDDARANPRLRKGLA
jgi:DNA-binding PadR family transcriptional regulator